MSWSHGSPGRSLTRFSIAGGLRPVVRFRLMQASPQFISPTSTERFFGVASKPSALSPCPPTFPPKKPRRKNNANSDAVRISLLCYFKSLYIDKRALVAGKAGKRNAKKTDKMRFGKQTCACCKNRVSFLFVLRFYARQSSCGAFHFLHRDCDFRLCIAGRFVNSTQAIGRLQCFV